MIVAGEEAFVRDRFAAALVDAGHTAVPVTTASSLRETLLTHAGSVDLILLDLRLGRAAAEVITSIRAIRARVPILVWSGTVRGAADVRQLAALGIAGYVNEYAAVDRIMPALAPHLFPDNFDRRGSPRVLLGIAVSCRAGDTITAAVTLNLGRGGLGVRTMSPLEVHAKVVARFRLPGSSHEIEAESRVPWSDRRRGMGLQFEKLEAADQEAIDELVASSGT